MIATLAALAALSCSSPETVLTVSPLQNNQIKVTLMDKFQQSRVPQKKVFVGDLIEESKSFGKVSTYKLVGVHGDAGLKVFTTPVMSRLPTCRARVCPNGPYAAQEITAEFDFQGQVTDYECFKL